MVIGVCPSCRSLWDGPEEDVSSPDREDRLCGKCWRDYQDAREEDAYAARRERLREAADDERKRRKGER